MSKSHVLPASNSLRFLAPRELAEVLAISEATLRTWRVRNQGPGYVKFGRCVRYPERAVTAWIYSRLPNSVQARLAV